MKVLSYTKPYTLVITEMPKPKIRENELLIRIKACGICGSDVHGYTGKTGRRIPPLVMGHEASGVIEEIGSKAKGKFYTGQRVTFDSTIFCNDCVFCRSGMINHCINRQVFGLRLEIISETVHLPSMLQRRGGLFIQFPMCFASSMQLCSNPLLWQFMRLTARLHASTIQ